MTYLVIDKRISTYFISCMFHYYVVVKAYFIFQARLTKTGTGGKTCDLKKIEERAYRDGGSSFPGVGRDPPRAPWIIFRNHLQSDSF